MRKAVTGFWLRHREQPRPLQWLVRRFYWVQIGLIALAVVAGLLLSASILKGLLIRTALKQEMAHYWQRVARDPAAPLPDTKNLYGYRWQGSQRPAVLNGQPLVPGVHRHFVQGKNRLTVYGTRGGEHVLLVFGETNVDRLVLLFGLLPLIFALVVLYSVLWWVNRRVQRHLSPMGRLALTIQSMQDQPAQWTTNPFGQIPTYGNLEADALQTALSRYHDRLLDFVQREQRFTREVSHELRTPIAVLRGNLELCQLREPDHPLYRRMRHTLDDMQLLIDTLLSLARPQREPLPCQPIDWTALVQDVFEEVQSLAQARQMQLRFDRIENPTAPANLTLVKIILRNLIRNALNYAQGTELRVVVRADALLLADDGIGLNPDTPATGGAEQGYGIGLPLVARLCALLGWPMHLHDRRQFSHPDLPVLGPQSPSGLVVEIRFQD